MNHLIGHFICLSCFASTLYLLRNICIYKYIYIYIYTCMLFSSLSDFSQKQYLLMCLVQKIIVCFTLDISFYSLKVSFFWPGSGSGKFSSFGISLGAVFNSVCISSREHIAPISVCIFICMLEHRT